jgi:hypothetical protein
LRLGRRQARAGKREGETNGYQDLVHAHRSFPNEVLCRRHAPLLLRTHFTLYCRAIQSAWR